MRPEPAIVPRLLAEFLARLDAGELPDFEDVVRAHPEHADELRAAFRAECDRLERDTPPHGTSARYTVLGELGRGGMGTVLSVWDEDLRRELAMKVARDDGVAPSPTRIARFLAEARISGQLDHPGVVPVHELGVDAEGRPWFTMKRVRGRTFADVLTDVRAGRNEWTTVRALRVLLRVCEAVAYAHEKGVIHRDLKPANVMVGAFGEVYVMDWGLARAGESGVEASEGSAEHERGPRNPVIGTQEGQVLGTPAYMPPEQAAGRVRDVGTHSDVYAIGAMLRDVVVDARENAAFDAWPTSAPPELAAICRRAMAADWRGRYASVRELSQDLAALLDGRVVRAHEHGAVAEARKWIGRNRGLAAALAFAVIALLAGLSASIVLRARSEANLREAREVARFLEDMLAGVAPSVAVGRDTSLLAEMLDAARARIEAGELDDAPEAELRLAHRIGVAYREIARYEIAEPLLRRARARADDVLARDDPLRATIEGELGLLLDARGAQIEAETCLRAALAARRRAHPGDHADVAASLQNLATSLRSRGDLDGAKALLVEAIGMLDRLGDPATAGARARVNLSVVLQEQGAVDEASRLAREALDRAPDSDALLVSAIQNVRASLAAARGDLVEAEASNRTVLALRRRIHGGDHPDVAASLNNLGFVLYERGSYGDAEVAFDEALEMQRRVVHGDHPDLAATLDNLAAARVAQGKASAAEELQLEALEIRRRLQPAGSADVAIGLHNLAAGLRGRGEHARAEPLAREALTLARAFLPPDHPQIGIAGAGLGLVLAARGDAAGAEDEQRAAIEVFERALAAGDGASGVRLARSRLHLARALLAQEKFVECEEVLLALKSGAVPAPEPEVGQLWSELYTAWERAEPDGGHVARARAWRESAENSGAR